MTQQHRVVRERRGRVMTEVPFQTVREAAQGAAALALLAGMLPETQRETAAQVYFHRLRVHRRLEQEAVAVVVIQTAEDQAAQVAVALAGIQQTEREPLELQTPEVVAAAEQAVPPPVATARRVVLA